MEGIYELLLALHAHAQSHRTGREPVPVLSGYSYRFTQYESSSSQAVDLRSGGPARLTYYGTCKGPT